MLRKDTIIEDAIVDVVEAKTELRDRLHPQSALWLARGFLCIVIGAGVLVIRPSLSARPAADVQDAALSAAAFTPIPVRADGDAAATTMAALLPGRQSRPAATAVLTPYPPRATPRPDTRDTSRAPVTEDLVIEPVRPPKIRSSDEAKSRIQRPGRPTIRSARAMPRPLTLIARGARRTVRSVGFVVSRLF